MIEACKLSRIGKLGIAVLGCMVIASSAMAEPDIDEKADELLKKMSATIKEAQNLSVEVVSDINIEISGLKQTLSQGQTVAISRPNRFALRSEQGAMGGMTVVSNGENLYQHLSGSGMNFYVEKEAPGSLAEFQASQLDEVPGAGAMLGEMGNQIPSVDVLMSEDPYHDLTSKMESIRYAQLETIDGVEAHKLEFANEIVDFTMWLSNDDNPLPLRARADLGKMFEQIAQSMPGGENLQAAVDITYKDWNLAAQLTDADFAFTPPEDARKVDSIMEGMEEHMERAMGQRTPQRHSLEGESAPLFEAELLSGEPFVLEELIGDKVVLLDFWATWCPPCRAAMPVVEQIAEEYHDNLVVLSVNQGEGRDVINNFLDSRDDLQPTVVFDQSMEIGRLYSVSGYPTFVIIDQDGIVKNVFVGFNERGIREALEALTGGA